MKFLLAVFLLLTLGNQDLAQAQVWPSDVNLAKYNYVDPTNLVPEVPLRRALTYYDVYYNRIQNKNYITVIDMSQHNTKKRKFIIDMKTGRVQALLVAHGKGSDLSHTGYARKFSNTSGSNATSVGMYITSTEYQGSNGRSMKLNGLEKTNSNARSRAIVVHGAKYVDPSYKPLGRSWGCPAVEMKHINSVIDRLKNGSVYYIWDGK